MTNKMKILINMKKNIQMKKKIKINKNIMMMKINNNLKSKIKTLKRTLRL